MCLWGGGEKIMTDITDHEYGDTGRSGGDQDLLVANRVGHNGAIGIDKGRS